MAVRNDLPPDLTRFLETIWQIKQERASAAAEVVRERREMDEYARVEHLRRYGPDASVIKENAGLTTEYAEVQ